MYIYSFEKLEVWIEAKELTKIVYNVTSQFPETEKFGLTSQLRRASISTCSNLAEGSTRTSARDQAHFSSISFGSSIEVFNQIILALELGLVSKQEYNMLRTLIENLTRKINALRNHQLSRINK